MKTIILTLILVKFSTTSFAQHLIIHKNDGSRQNINLTEVDSLTFCPTTITYLSKVYNVVMIGDQCWLKENLDVGTRIDGSFNQSDNNPNYIEKYCYNDDPAYCETYGGLYQWNEAMKYITTEGAQGICPNGWHIPTMVEFATLMSTVSGDGNALKEIGQGSGGGAGTNTSGFSALLAGRRRTYSGYFDYLTSRSYFLSSTNWMVFDTQSLILYDNSSIIILNENSIYLGYSVRCIKD